MELKLNGGLTAIFIGAPGLGKSTMIGSILEVPGVERALLLAAKPRESNSFIYRKHHARLDVEIFRDHKWAPGAGRYEAGAFTKLFERVLSLYDDDKYDAILLDPFTDVTYLAAHELMQHEKVGTPRDLRDSIGFYGALKYKLKDFTQSLTGLASSDLKRPKHVLVTVHAQPTKEDQQLPKSQGGGTKESSDNRGQGVEFMGDALPMIEGAYRREIAGEFDIVGFSSVKYEMTKVGNVMSREAKYVVQLNADPERHAKAAVVPRLKEKEVANSMVEIFRVIKEASV